MNKNQLDPEHARVANEAEARIRDCINQKAVAAIVSVTSLESAHQEDECDTLPIAN